MATAPAFTNTINNGVANITTTSATTVFTASANGSIITKILITTTEEVNTIAVTLSARLSATDYPVGYVVLGLADSANNIPLYAHGNFLYEIDVAPAEVSGPTLRLETGYTLVAQLDTAPTAGKQVTIFIEGGDL